jgi:hypothetical protein
MKVTLPHFLNFTLKFVLFLPVLLTCIQVAPAVAWEFFLPALAC